MLTAQYSSPGPSNQVVLSLTVDVVGDADFFDEDKIIDNLAALLGIDKSKIKIANIVKESKLTGWARPGIVLPSNPSFYYPVKSW